MKVLSLFFLLGISCVLCASAPQQQSVTPPGLAAANKAVRQGEQLEPPMITPAREISPAKLEREADELKKLADSVQKQVRLVGSGQLSANLPKNLKRIAQLTHKLRLQLSR